jgi:hypothetical protein
MRRSLVLVFTLLSAGLVCGSGPPAEEFSSKEGKFKVAFPGKPKEQKQAAAGTTMQMYVVENPNGAYIVGYGDMPIPEKEPAEKIKDRLDGAVLGMAGATGGKVLEQKDIRIARTLPGRQFQIAITKPMEGLIRGKIYLSGKRLYQVFVVGTKDFAKSAGATKFLDSFMITR